MSIIKTSRLILRPWHEKDFELFAQLNRDPRVMEYFPSLLSHEESDQMAKRIKTKIEERGWGLWAATIADSQEFIGFIGLNDVPLDIPFAPGVEIGWRLAFEHWGKGYATEGARAVLQFGFENLLLEEILSFTAIQNLRSRRVMERIGMHHNPQDDFDHPKLPEGHPLKRHVLYRITKKEMITP